MTEPKTLTLSQLVERLAAAERALREIGNLVGGPTMTYAPSIEIREWRMRADRSKVIIEATGAYSAKGRHGHTEEFDDECQQCSSV